MMMMMMMMMMSYRGALHPHRKRDPAIEIRVEELVAELTHVHEVVHGDVVLHQLLLLRDQLRIP